MVAASPQASAPQAAAFLDFLRVLDRNRDGRISYSEFMALVSKCGWRGDGAALWGEIAAYVAGAHSVPLGEEAPQSWVRHDAELVSQSEHAPPTGAAAAQLPQLGQGITDVSAAAELQARVTADPEAFSLSRDDVLRLYSSPGYSEDESATDRELIEQVLRTAFEEGQASGSVSGMSFDDFVAEVLKVKRVKANEDEAEWRIPPRLLNTAETSADEFVSFLERLVATHPAATHAYLHRLASGDLPYPALALVDWARQYSRYSGAGGFTQMVGHVMEVMQVAEERASLQEALDEEKLGVLDDAKRAALAEAGIDAAWCEGIPHTQLFVRLREALEARVPASELSQLKALAAVAKLRRVSEPGVRFASQMVALAGSEGEAGAVGLLGLAVEGIVAHIYPFIQRALRAQFPSMPASDSVFLPLHIVADDDHAAVLRAIAVRLAGGAEARFAMVHAVRKALHARAMLWDKLLARALRFKPPRSIAALASAPTTRATAAQMYDAAATGWVRKEASCLSDFTGREPIFAQLKPLVAGGARVLDIGCGEGYVARRLRTMGAAQVVGVDISQEMINRANDTEAAEPMGGLHFFQGDATAVQGVVRRHLPALGVATGGETGLFDVVIAVFCFNYLNSEAMQRVVEQAHALLKPGGTFLFSVPHPAFSFMGRPQEKPFYFARDSKVGYFSGKDCAFEGEIFTKDGRGLPVRCMHKPFEVYFQALAAAGFNSLPTVKELGVSKELAAAHATFAPLQDVPLHAMFCVQRGAKAVPDAKLTASHELTWSALFSDEEMVVDVPPAAMEELADVCKRLVAKGVTVETYTNEMGGLLPHVRELGRAIAHRVFRHCGAALLKLDMEALGAGANGFCTAPGSEEAAKLAYYILCSAVGEVQQEMGRLFEVRNRGLDVRNDNVLFSVSSQECTFHTDSTNRFVHPDIVALLCVRPASGAGGVSLMSNAVNAFYNLKSRLPAFLMYELERGTTRDLITASGLGAQGDALELLGRSPAVLSRRLRGNRFPIFARRPAGSAGESALTFRYMRTWVESGHRRAGLRVSPLLRVAMDLLDAELDICAPVNRRLTPGEVLFCNNHILGHARTAFEDSDTSGGHPGRLLVRAWINCDQDVLA